MVKLPFSRHITSAIDENAVPATFEASAMHKDSSSSSNSDNITNNGVSDISSAIPQVPSSTSVDTEGTFTTHVDQQERHKVGGLIVLGECSADSTAAHLRVLCNLNVHHVVLRASDVTAALDVRNADNHSDSEKKLNAHRILSSSSFQTLIHRCAAKISRLLFQDGEDVVFFMKSDKKASLDSETNCGGVHCCADQSELMKLAMTEVVRIVCDNKKRATSAWPVKIEEIQNWEKKRPLYVCVTGNQLAYKMACSSFGKYKQLWRPFAIYLLILTNELWPKTTYVFYFLNCHIQFLT